MLQDAETSPSYAAPIPQYFGPIQPFRSERITDQSFIEKWNGSLRTLMDTSSASTSAVFLCQASFLQSLGPFAILGTMTVDQVLFKVIGSIEALFSVALAKTMNLL